MAAEVEDAHLVKIDVVTLGDAQLDERSEALVAAAREALFNAAKHAGDAPISLFGEVDEHGVTATCVTGVRASTWRRSQRTAVACAIR